MLTNPLKPILFLAFANARHDSPEYLRDLPEEARRLRQTLDQAARHNLCEVVFQPDATLREILDVFQDARYRDRIALFHYGGHANGYQLLLESASGATAAADAGGLAAFLGRQTGLQLVFLNGCSTQPQVEELQDAGVPAVIATAQAIDDKVAMEFADRFYHGLANGLALRPAFDQAAAALQAATSSQNPRGLYWDQTDQPADRWPWDFYLKAGAKTAADWNLPQAVGDYLFGLPELPLLDLPPSPFRHLYWYEREHAPLFFGREQAIRDLYQRITNPATAPLILLYGQSGVGKSSLLAAGVLPRLERDYAICYQRRDPVRGLVGSLSTALQMENEAPPTGQRWRELEQAGRPLVIILDQVEEIFTRPLAEVDEFKEFLAALSDIFAAVEQRPQGKLILGFRKEWLAEIEQRLIEQRLPLVRVFLERLDDDDIVRVVCGPVQTPRLQTHYGLSLEDKDLPDLIAGDLLADPESPIAPTLQILLTKMWTEAIKENPDHPGFSKKLYHRLQKEGLLLADFLNQQLDELRAWQPPVETSGLVLDVLAYYTTPMGTATQHSRQELIETYAHQAELLPQVVQKCRDLYLLADLSKNRPDQTGASQLSHDTLAPLVRRQFDESDRPGQRARRILESRAVEWGNGQTGAPLDEADLALVEQGQAGMRAWTKAEGRLVQASRLKQAARLRTRRLLWTAGIASVLFIIFLAGLFFWQWSEAQKGKTRSDVRALLAEGQAAFEENPLLGLRLALEAWYRIPAGQAEEEKKLRFEVEASIWDKMKQGRISKLGDDIEGVWFNHNPLAFVLSKPENDELRYINTAKVVSLPGDISSVDFSQDGAFVYIAYQGSPFKAEIRYVETGELVPFSDQISWGVGQDGVYWVSYTDGRAAELHYSKTRQVLPPTGAIMGWFFYQDSNYLQVQYYDAVERQYKIELRNADTAQAITLPHPGVEWIYFDPHKNYFVVDYTGEAADELYYPAQETVLTIPGEVVSCSDAGDSCEVELTPGQSVLVWLSPKGDAFVITAPDGTARELRHIGTGKVIPLSGIIKTVKFSPDGRYFLVKYRDGAPGELRRTDTGEAMALSGNVYDLWFSPDNDYFVVSYVGETPPQWRRHGSNEAFNLPIRDLNDVFFSPNGAYFLLIPNIPVDKPQLWYGLNTPRQLAELDSQWDGEILSKSIALHNGRLITHYENGRAYLLDINWLEAMTKDYPVQPTGQTLIELACRPFLTTDFLGQDDEQTLTEKLPDGQPRSCLPENITERSQVN